MELLGFKIFLLLCALRQRKVILEKQDPGDVCPPERLIDPCTCSAPLQKAILSCKNVDTVAQMLSILDKSSSYLFYAVEFGYCSMAYLPSQLFNDKLIQNVSIYYSNFISFFNEIPQENSVEYITVRSSNFIQEFTWSYLTNFKKLKEIDFSSIHLNDKIESIFNESVSKTLESLFLRDSQVTSLDDYCFSAYNKLHTISIYWGSIKELNKNMFPSSVTDFMIADQEISSVPSDLFSNMRELTYINLVGHLLTALDDNLFQGLTNLDTVNLGGNKIAIFDDRLFQTQKKLQILYLNDNPISCDCSFKWILNLQKQMLELDGACLNPPHLEGKLIKNLRLGDFSQC